VFLTIVQPQPLVVHLNVEEKEVHLLKPDAEGVVKITSQPDRKVTGRIAKLSAAPTLPGKYPALVKLDAGKDDGLLVPGMACSIKFVPYAKKSAIVIPTKYVHDEDGKDVVFVLTSDGKQEMRAVTKGRTHGDDMEIVSGLRDDDEVLIERPSTTKGATP
jgi:multidrug efflux pump subunit AcrA (membrane-fusion protein)